MTDPATKDEILILEYKNEQLRKVAEERQEKIESLEAEKQKLYVYIDEIEKQNQTFITLCVALYHLYSTRNYVDVIKIIEEISTNLLGIEKYSIYVYDKGVKRFTLLSRIGGKSSFSDGHQKYIQDILENGRFYVAGEADFEQDNGPVACIPLKIQREVLGVIILDKLMVQKKKITDNDQELFRLLGEHASNALFNAKHYWIIEAETKQKLRDTVEDLTPPTQTSLLKLARLIQKKEKK